MEVEKVIKNISAERTIIGCLINNPEWLIELNGLIKTENFALLSHKTIFHIISLLLQEGYETIDSMTILTRAENIVRASEVIHENGGINYLEDIKLLSEHITLSDLKKNAKIVATCAYKRDYLDMLENTKKTVYNENEWGMAEIDGYAQNEHQTLLEKYQSGSEVGLLGDKFDDIWAEMEEEVQCGLVGLPPKFELLRKFFTYMNGELVVIGARPKYGKSNFAINEVHYLAVELGIPIAYLDTEMKTKIFISRIIALDSGVAINEIRDGSYKKDFDKLMAVEASKKRIKEAPIIHEYRTNWTRESVIQFAKLMKIRHDIGFLVYDYIKVKEVEKNGGKEHNELGNWTIALKDLAGDLDIPILTFGQLSPYEKRLADSDKINRYASVIAYLLPKTQEETLRDFGENEGGKDWIYIDYNRNGASMQDCTDQTKGVNFNYNRIKCTMSQAPYQHEEVLSLTQYDN